MYRLFSLQSFRPIFSVDDQKTIDILQLIMPNYIEMSQNNSVNEASNKAISSESVNISQQLGVLGKYAWFIRIGSYLIFIGTIYVNTFLGTNVPEVSHKYHLYTTPSDMFFAIWAVIYTSLFLANTYNLIKNQWTPAVHFWYSLSNLANIAWVFVFGIGTNAAVFSSSFILLILAGLVFKTWFALGDRHPDSFSFSTYVIRNTFAFYLGWLIAASNIGLGFDFVYWWGVSKKTQVVLFWVIAPLCAVGGTAFNYLKEGKRGFLSCFLLWVSVAWAFIGAGIRTYHCTNGCRSDLAKCNPYKQAPSSINGKFSKKTRRYKQNNKDNE